MNNYQRIPLSQRSKSSLIKENQELRKQLNKIQREKLEFENVFDAAEGVVLNFFPNRTIEEIKGKRRFGEVVFPRHLAMYLLHTYTDKSLNQIGQHFGGRDHSTVINARENIRYYLETNKLKRDLINKVCTQFKDALSRTGL